MALVTVIALLVNLAGIGCGVASLATTSWINPGVGLFQNCLQFITEHCTITIGDDKVVLAVACLICVGLLLSIPAVVLLFVDLLRSNRKKLVTAGVLLIIASIFVCAGAAIYTALRKPEGVASLLQAFGFSYYMSWGSCGGLLIAAVLAFAASRNA